MEEMNKTIEAKSELMYSLANYLKDINTFNSIAEDGKLLPIDLTELFMQYTKKGNTVNLAYLSIESLRELVKEVYSYHLYCCVMSEEVGALPVILDGDKNFHVITTMEC
jgi:hypothetical protein